MASRLDREGAQFTRDNVDARARGHGHDLAWQLGENATRKGHAYFFVGTCTNCGGNAEAGAAWSSCTSVVDARNDPCSGPGTAILTEIEQGRYGELVAEAVAEFGAAVQRSEPTSTDDATDGW